MPSPLTSPQALRLLWRLQGALAESIFVIGNWDTQDPPREPFATQNLTGNISWHAISQESLTKPKIKTISDITWADNMLGDRKPEEYEYLVVDITNPQYLSIIDEKRFLGYRYTGPPVQMSMSEEHAYLLSNVLTLDVPPFRNIPHSGGDYG
ncbi:hypothetical protein CGCVW01_v002953 [Colletotrichum viniferum]|nr:hypothetical protein CGCVW01_v002953 [Colletotrichum viniferum]